MCSESLQKAKKLFKGKREVPKGLLDVRIIVPDKRGFWVPLGELREGNRITTRPGAQPAFSKHRVSGSGEVVAPG